MKELSYKEFMALEPGMRIRLVTIDRLSPSSMKERSKEIGVTGATISRFIKGDAPIDYRTLIRIARFVERKEKELGISKED